MVKRPEEKSIFHAGTLVFVALLFDATLAQLIPHGTQQIYNLESRVQSANLAGAVQSGYHITGRLTVASVWTSDDRQILGFEFDSLKLSTVKDGQLQAIKKSELDSLANRPFYLLLNDNVPREFYSDVYNDFSLQNFQKGIASLFQFNFKETIANEEDVSGSCSVLYQKHSSTSHRKVKTECANWTLKVHRRIELPLDIKSKSYQEIDYKLSQDGILHKLASTERHSFVVRMNTLLGNAIESLITLQHTTGSDQFEKTAGKVNPEYLSANFEGSSLEAEVDARVQGSDDASSLHRLINEKRDQLSDEKLGTQDLGLLFAELLPHIRHALEVELVELLKSQLNTGIRNQLIDLLAAAQTKAAYTAITTVFKFNRDNDFLPLERYLQGTAVGTRPHKDIMQNLIQKVAKIQNEKLKETTLLAVSAMAYRYAQLSPSGTDSDPYKSVALYIAAEFDKCQSTDCKAVLIRCEQNIKDPKNIGRLLAIALKENQTLSVAAMKALKVFRVEYFTNSDRKDMETMFYQLKRRYDSSARLLALDILLDMRPNRKQLGDLLRYLTGTDTAFEVKTYLLQKITMIANQCPKFAALIRSVVNDCQQLQNYDVLAQSGLSTVLQRQFSGWPSFNGSLLSIQEVNKGVLKRGLVDMTIAANGEAVSVFTLWLYTHGLSSFVGGSVGDDDTDEKSDDETATAGMELTVLGVQMRPLIFFTGQGELMGHVWSGTASNPTPAYQSTILMHDHEEYIVLQTGATVYLRLLSAKSIDLHGQVQFSLWNRNAHTEINMDSGLGILGTLQIESSFVTLRNMVALATEPNIGLVADIDFYSDIKLCIQLKRVASKVRISFDNSHSVDGKQNEIKIGYVSYRQPGFTMALNQKNNEMCNVIFA